MKLSTPSDLETFRSTCFPIKDKGKAVYMCSGTGCRAVESEKIVNVLRREIESQALSVKIVETGCQGFCQMGPLLVIEPAGILYGQLREEDISDVVNLTLKEDKIIDRLLYEVPESAGKIENEKDIPFYAHQTKRILGMNRRISPFSIEDYITEGGYSSFPKALTEMSSEEIIAEVEKSGLRGRGGGGYPSGKKWRSCRDAHGEKHYLVCNADEGDPGAYMDQSLLEGNPHSVLEGMLIGALAIGASEGYVYVREEYPRAVIHIREAVKQALEWGLLGENILGTDFSFQVKVTKGGGAFVCGESTALMRSLEGKRGEPRTKHIHTVESGLYDMPTLLNNVETWANIPLIIGEGAEEFSSCGTAGSPGTKIFSLVGKVKNTGLIEVPTGMTLREVIFGLGGGIAGGGKFKAVQTGGPSGGCIPEKLLDTTVDFDELKKLGSMMGSGGMIVMDENTCMVEVARYFTSFLVHESCGKCTPCREGLWQILKILTRICEGDGREEDLEELETLGEMVADASLCGLGKTAANPVLSTLRYFPDEYREHIAQKKCGAGVCKKLFHYEIDGEKCTGCALCRQNCPHNAISGEKKSPHHIVTGKCTVCGICYDVCRFGAIGKVAG